MKRRAFSLLEITLAIAILGLLLAVSLANYRTGTRKAGPPALARVLAAELQAAQQRAIADQVFVVLRFPSTVSGICQSFQRYEGRARGTHRRGRNFSGEYADCGIFIGSWPLSSGAFSLDRSPTGREVPGFDLSAWLAPEPMSQDFMLVFAPTGAVWSNDLPLLDGHYVLVVGRQLAARPGAAPPGTALTSPPPPYYRLEQAVDPYCVELETTGKVSLVPGLGAATGVQLAPVGAASPPAPVAAAAAPGSNQAPVVEAIELSPSTPNLPGSVQGTIHHEDYLRLTVEARDAEGDGLTCQWTSDGGAFTSPGPTVMRWDPGRGRFVAHWSFRANPNDAPGKIYQLECAVRDRHGNLATAASGVLLSQNIEVRVKPFLAISEWPHQGLYTVEEDGGNLTQVPLPGMTPHFACVHPDGQTLAFCTGNYVDNDWQLWSVRKDGSNLRRLTDPALGGYGGCYSPDGTKYAFHRGANFLLMPACGEVDPTPAAAAELPPRQLNTPGMVPSWQQDSFRLDGKRIVMAARVHGGADEGLYVYDLDSDTVSEICPPIARVPTMLMYQACYSRNPAFANKIFGLRYTGTSFDLFVVNDDGSNFQLVPTPLGAGASMINPGLGRDGNSMFYYTFAANGVVKATLDFSTATASDPEYVLQVGNLRNLMAW